MTSRKALFFLVMLSMVTISAFGQSGKISGRVTDQSNQPLPGVNIVLVGSVQGSVSDSEGFYTILNVVPGTYDVRATFIGFTPQTVSTVRVNIDQTSTVNFSLTEETVGLDEVFVTAEAPVVQADVSNSQLNVSAEEIEALPVSSVSSVVGLQAGIQGLSVRGSGTSELSFSLNGLTLRDERDNTPYTNISLASVQEVQVQTGGFNAEYGNVRSGVVNVITKEGSADRYEVDAIMRYSAPANKHFGPLANDPDSYWIRPYIDPDVAYTGTTSGGWDEATQSQYPEFAGWISVADELQQDDNPDNDLSPEALLQAFKWQAPENARNY